MTQEQFEKLKRGDRVRSVSGEYSQVWMVSVHYGDRVTLVATHDMTNPLEWEIVCEHYVTQCKYGTECPVHGHIWRALETH